FLGIVFAEVRLAPTGEPYLYKFHRKFLVAQIETEIMANPDSVDANGREATPIRFEKAHDFSSCIFGSPKPQIDDAIAPLLALTQVHYGLGTTAANIYPGHQTAAIVPHRIMKRTLLRTLEPAQSE